MALKLAGRNPAKFIFDDGVSETTVTITPDDDPDTVRAKLQRVLELEGYEPPNAPPVRMVSLEPTFTPADRAATEERLEAVSHMGWNEDAGGDLSELPEV